MLPDLRLVIISTVSTFLLTIWAGLYASTRLTHEPLTSWTEKATGDETPINRISMSWPLPESSRPSTTARDLATQAIAKEAAEPEPAERAEEKTEARPAEDAAKIASRPEPQDVQTPAVAKVAPETKLVVQRRRKPAEPRYAKKQTTIHLDELGINPMWNPVDGASRYYTDFPSRPN